MDPTLHYKMKADEAYDGSGQEHRDLETKIKNTETDSCQR